MSQRGNAAGYRNALLAIAAAAGLVWAAGCGDGVTEPPAPPSDPPRPTTVTVSPSTAELTAVGATVQLAVEVRDQNGNAMAGAPVTWASSAPAVATVSSAGLVTAVSNGTVTITATAGSASGTATATVVQQVSNVAVSPATDTLVAGDTLRLSAVAADANGHPVAEAEFSWASSDTLVAVVDDAGLVTGVGAGQAEVMVTSAEVTGRAQLLVVAPAPTTVAVTPDTVALTALGQTAQFAAEVRDQAGRVMEDVPVDWSSADTQVVAIDSTGLVTAVGRGVTTVAAAAGSASGTAVASVMQSAGSVVVSPSSETVAPGDTLRLVAEAFDENGHAIGGTEFAWSSSDASVATVDDAGLVRGIAEGAATITATAGSASGTSRIAVENPDRAALVALYEATDGPNWIDSRNWLTDAPLGEWYGVETDALGRVVRLDLSGSRDLDAPGQPIEVHGLTGAIPRELGHLGSLLVLDLEYNDLSGPIPSELGALADLRELRLGRNDLSGPIPPELGGLAKLERLDLVSNDLSGPIPPSLGGLAKLERLDLGFNDLSGPIPPELGNLASLRRLRLGYNDLSGPIPPELGNLASLWQLSIRNNDLSGVLPPELGNLRGMTWIDLRNNSLSGAVPGSFLQLDRVFFLQIAGNRGLCVPGTPRFADWLRGIREHDAASNPCNAADAAALKSLFEAAGGTNWSESGGWLGDGALETWYGVTADSLGHVTQLDLTRNGLTGRLPRDLGDLAQMTHLRIGDNALSGRLPSTLSRLSLVELHYAGTELCAPAEASFRAWLAGIPVHEGTGEECAPLSEREILEILYEATGGPNWTNRDNWLTDAPLRDWHGVSVDGDGRVRVLWLGDNNLTGTISPELGEFPNLRSVYLSGNNLTGEIPPELGNLSTLEWLWISGNKLTGPIPAELGNLATLENLNLYNNHLNGPIPPELGRLAGLHRLSLSSNALTGSIPPELGNLANLKTLFIGSNPLEGPIPPELGQLSSLERLSLRDSDLTGPIPPELGNLASLTHMWLWGNELTGPIPPELGNLTSLRDAYLGDNDLSGAIPRELAGLDNIKDLYLGDNALTGAIPPELGDLSTLEGLVLANNALTGSVPPEFGGMSSLKQLALTNNTGMAGALPSRLADLRQLEELLVGGTDLCAPSDPDFQAWLDGVHKRRIAQCVEGEAPMAYLTQAVQSREFPVPLVAGEEALLRVFPTSRQATSAGMPAVRARFYRDGRETHVENIPGKSAPIPRAVDESRLSASANAEIPGHVVQPGLEMVIEVDPESALDPALGVARRIPEEGRLPVDVRAMPILDLTLIPFIWSRTHDSSIVKLVDAIAAVPENHELLEETRTLLPVADLDVAAHEPVLSSSNDVYDLLANTQAIRAMEGRTGHYMGMMSRPVTGAAGVAFIAGRVSFSIPASGVIAHELGHNMSLWHAPCGGAAGPDPSFPYPDGSIGAWGYDSRDGGSLVHPRGEHPRGGRDLMSYCGPWWISDFSFTNALRYRLFDEGAQTGAAAAATARSLLLWGGIGADSVPYLEPAFVVESPATLPDSAGEYRVTGRTDAGDELFSLSFTMPETADGDGSSSFAFTLPVRPEWEGNLAAITLAGPEGSFSLNGESDIPMAILRNPRTGQVRGILRDLPPATQASADVPRQTVGQGLEVLFSRGIPRLEARRR